MAGCILSNWSRRSIRCCRDELPSITKSLGEVEELLLLSLLGFHPVFDRIKHCGLRLRSYLGLKADALKDRFSLGSHHTIVHENPAPN